MNLWEESAASYFSHFSIGTLIALYTRTHTHTHTHTHNHIFYKYFAKSVFWYAFFLFLKAVIVQLRFITVKGYRLKSTKGIGQEIRERERTEKPERPVVDSISKRLRSARWPTVKEPPDTICILCPAPTVRYFLFLKRIVIIKPQTPLQYFVIVLLLKCI